MRIHTSTYRVQLYDVDAFGELSSTAVLRFLQQAATDASAALGFDLEWYERQRALWVIHRTTIDVLAPSFYRDELAVRTGYRMFAAYGRGASTSSIGYLTRSRCVVARPIGCAWTSSEAAQRNPRLNYNERSCPTAWLRNVANRCR